MGLTIHTTTRRPWPTRGFSDIAQAILGTRYDCSLVIVGDRRARTLNRTRRGRDAPANVLTFPITNQHGEVFINVRRVEREAHTFGLSKEGHAQYLFIHACLHLKGYAHGSRMERAEDRFLARFDIR